MVMGRVAVAAAAAAAVLAGACTSTSTSGGEPAGGASGGTERQGTDDGGIGEPQGGNDAGSGPSNGTADAAAPNPGGTYATVFVDGAPLSFNNVLWSKLSVDNEKALMAKLFSLPGGLPNLQLAFPEAGVGEYGCTLLSAVNLTEPDPSGTGTITYSAYSGSACALKLTEFDVNGFVAGEAHATAVRVGTGDSKQVDVTFRLKINCTTVSCP